MSERLQVNSQTWTLLDTETTGLIAPIFVVEIGAQRMRGWTPEGPPFRRLLNQNADIPPEASRVHGYTREILERDGENPFDVYTDFARYVGGVPLVAYNLTYDLDGVLLPEWQRLGVPPIGKRGFCALKLAQRLLDPVPAGNCKLQTLRQFYRLPERGAHTALGDVETVADLFGQVLRPLAEERGLHTWEQLVGFTEASWFPSRIAFGKHKGRDFREAINDPDLRGWLEWLAASPNQRSATMGQWYLSQFDRFEAHHRKGHASFAGVSAAGGAGNGIVVYVDPDVEELKRLIAAARSRLADLEAEYTRERHQVEVTQSRLFQLLREHYQRRDRLKLVVDYRRRYLDALLESGEDKAEDVSGEYDQARRDSDDEYAQAEAQARGQRDLSPEDSAELKTLWRKLVRLFHPDRPGRFGNDPKKRAAFEWLTGEINQARDRGNVERLREIANDSNGFMLRQGYDRLDFTESVELVHLRRLLDTLQERILAVLEALNDLREDPRYELHTLVTQQPELLDDVAAKHAVAIEREITILSGEAERLAQEIEMLTGARGPGGQGASKRPPSDPERS